jgi:hypothetical protein
VLVGIARVNGVAARVPSGVRLRDALSRIRAEMVPSISTGSARNATATTDFSLCDVWHTPFYTGVPNYNSRNS